MHMYILYVCVCLIIQMFFDCMFMCYVSMHVYLHELKPQEIRAKFCPLMSVVMELLLPS